MPSPPRTPSRPRAKRALSTEEAFHQKETTKEQLARLSASRIRILEGASKFMEFAKLFQSVGERPDEAALEQQRARDEVFVRAVELADKEFAQNIAILKGELSEE